MRMFFAREERPRLNAHRNPPSKVVTRQPNLLMRAPDARPQKFVSAIASEPTQAKKSEHTNVAFDNLVLVLRKILKCCILKKSKNCV